MTVSCPACSKKNDLRTAAACVRCSCDLSRLRDVLIAAVDHLRCARLELENCNWPAALAWANRSWELVHTPISARTACLAAVANGDATALVLWRRRAEAAGPPAV